MTKPEPRPPAGGEQEALLFILQIAIGAVAWVLIASVVRDRMLGETLGFFGMWAAIFPFARRTWAAALPIWRYWAAAVTGTAVGAVLRLLLQ
ncbi:MAG TPA: hypothetical protein VGK75_01515 [Casimicrobiaceae bacterium]